MVGFHNICHLSYLSLVHPMQGLVLPWDFLWLDFDPCLLLPSSFSQNLISGCHLADMLLNALGFIQDGFCLVRDTHLSPSTLSLTGGQSLGVGLGVEASVHHEEFPGLHIGSLSVLS